MSDSVASPAPLDVPRLTRSLYLLSLPKQQQFEAIADEYYSDPSRTGTGFILWNDARESELREDAAVLRAALSGLVEAGALVDRTEKRLRANPDGEVLLDFGAGGFTALLTDDRASVLQPTVREALLEVLPAVSTLPDVAPREIFEVGHDC